MSFHFSMTLFVNIIRKRNEEKEKEKEKEGERVRTSEFKKMSSHERQLLSSNNFNKAVQFNFRSVGSRIMKSIVKKG